MEEESWAHGQATYIWQKKPHSTPRIRHEAEQRRRKGYSFSGTLFFACGPDRGELYFNPEVVQAVPMSGLTGLGG